MHADRINDEWISPHSHASSVAAWLTTGRKHRIGPLSRACLHPHNDRSTCNSVTQPWKSIVTLPRKTRDLDERERISTKLCVNWDKSWNSLLKCSNFGCADEQTRFEGLEESSEHLSAIDRVLSCHCGLGGAKMLLAIFLLVDLFLATGQAQLTPLPSPQRMQINVTFSSSDSCIVDNPMCTATNADPSSAASTDSSVFWRSSGAENVNLTLRLQQVCPVCFSTVEPPERNESASC